MHPSQERAHQIVAEGVILLSDALVDAYDIDEDEALDIVRDLPDIVTRLQDKQIKELYTEAEHSVRQNRANVVDLPNPKEYYPQHPKFMPPITTKHTFNAHMAQAMAPYVNAIAKKIAKDRSLEAPDARTIQSVLEKTDWARAAYEAKRMPPKPPPGRVRQFFTKYIFRPLDKATDKIPFAQVFGLIGATHLLMMLWATFGQNLENIGETHLKPMDKFYDWRAKRAALKISRITGLKF
jgi:hypothetical protein